jgi:hypothetical protein
MHVSEIVPRGEEFAAAKSRSAALPWWSTIAAKIVLSRVVPGYAWRRKLSLFRHSCADSTRRDCVNSLARIPDGSLLVATFHLCARKPGHAHPRGAP